MNAVPIAALALGAVLSVFVVAAPAHAQSAADLAPRLSLEAVTAYPDVRSEGEVIRRSSVDSGRDRARFPAPALAISPAAAARRRSATAFTVGGALAGAVIGTVVLFAPAHCRTAESMCGLLLPVAAGGGAAIGGLIGYLIGTAE